MLKDCGIEKKDAQLVFNSLIKLPFEYSSFVPSSQTHQLTMGNSYAAPSFDAFVEILMFEQNKLTSMGIIKTSKSTALMVKQGNQMKQEKGKVQKIFSPMPQGEKQHFSSP